jgi:hypothetical protein
MKLVPSLHHPLQTFHNRVPSPPQFRDLNLPSMQSGRQGEIEAPTSLLGMIPDALAREHDVSFLSIPRQSGRRLPPQFEGLNIMPDRGGQ